MSNIAYHQGVYFLSTQSNAILIVDSTTRSLINIVTAPDLSGIRDMIFLNDGQTMVVASANNQLLFFFNRSSSSPTDYAYMSNLTTSFVAPHGLTVVNDTFFYATSWGLKNIYSFATSDGGVTWKETLFIDTHALASNRWGSHVTIDDCQRFWFSTSDNGLLIYDSQGQLKEVFNSTWDGVFDAIFMGNYVMLLSDRIANKIIRLDPQIEC